jgi:hypothetical protein
VLIGGEEDPVAIAAPVREIGQDAEAEEIGRRVQGDALLGGQALTSFDFLRNGPERGVLQAGGIELAGHRISLENRG